MPGPQLENGYTRLANELLEAMVRTVFSPNETRVILYIARMTYGYNKKNVRISGQQWEEATGIKRTHIYRTLRKLQERNVVTMVGHKGSRKVGIQKHYKKWKTVTGPGLSDQVRSQLVTMVGHSLPIISKRQLKERGNCPNCGGPKKEDWHKVCDNCYKPPEGRVQPKGNRSPPCKECKWIPPLGYQDMKDGICLDCRQE